MITDETITGDTMSASMLLENEKKNVALNLVYCILLALFLISLNGLQKFPALFFINKAAGGLLVILGFVSTGKFYVAKLLKIFGVFIAFAFFSGFFVAINQTLLWDTTMKLVQLLLLLIAVSQFYIFKGEVRWLMIALLLNALVLAFAGKFLSADLVFSGKIERYSSITNNANGLAFQLLLGVIATLFFYHKEKFIYKILVAIGVGVLMYYIAISGSRKSSAAFLLVIAAWVFFSFRTKKMLQLAVTLFLLLLAGGSYLYAILEDTAVFQRVSYLEDDTSATDIRKILYREAFGLFQSYPFFGVGLANFQEYSVSGLYAHSNYMELLADTGLIGFLLFYSIYFLVWRNSDKMVKLFDGDEKVLFLSGLNKIILILFLVIGAGAVQYDNIAHWILLLFPIILHEKAIMLQEATPELPLEEQIVLDESGNIPV